MPWDFGRVEQVDWRYLAQAAPIGDDPVYKTGPYKGKGLNKLKGNYTGPPAAEL